MFALIDACSISTQLSISRFFLSNLPALQRPVLCRDQNVRPPPLGRRARLPRRTLGAAMVQRSWENSKGALEGALGRGS